MSFTESIETSDNKRQFLATTIQQMADEFKDDEDTQKTFKNMFLRDYYTAVCEMNVSVEMLADQPHNQGSC